MTLLLAGCGTGGLATGSADEDNGRTLFQKSCASCHALAAANAQGQIGPNLDASFAQARADGYAESAIREIVHAQIKYPGQYATGDGPARLQANMPANLVRGQDAEDVASYVAANAGTQGFAEPQKLASNDGKTIFKSKCGTCHTLADAGTTGTIGPNLDALKADLARVMRQVINGGGAMPAFKGSLTDAQIKAVSQYVASATGK